MSFGDFAFPQVLSDPSLTLSEADLFSSTPSVTPRDSFAATVADGAAVALAIDTEKAKSEFIIAPILLELRRLLGGAIGLFSGVELNVDPARGLNGTCDFILAGAPRQSILSAPLVTIVESRNDNLRSGLGQCIAAMRAAYLFNEQAGNPVDVVHGVVTTGAAWKFLRLAGAAITPDLREYYIDDVGQILGILTAIVASDPGTDG